MKTSHQFARELLAGPDLTIGFIDQRDGRIMNPAVSHIKGWERDGEPSEMLELGQQKAEPVKLIPETPEWRLARDLVGTEPEPHSHAVEADAKVQTVCELSAKPLGELPRVTAPTDRPSLL